MTVEILRRGTGKKYSSGELRQIAAMLLQALEQDRAELSIAIVGDKEMRHLNAKYRNMDKTTDVLSFPSEEKLPGGIALLGDVIISVEQARRQARERKKTLQSEMATLLIHGILHLLGYDHERSQRQAKIMGRMERKLYGHLCDGRQLKL